MRAPSVVAENVSVEIDGRWVLSGLDGECPPGQITGLVGPSGCGKTTFLHVLGLLVRPTAGRVLIGGESTSSWKARQIRRFWQDDAAFVLQDYGVIEEESVAFNVSMTSGLGSSAGGDQGRVRQSLELAHLPGRQKDRASHLSGGEKQRLSIARAIYKEAGCLFADEPTASLDAQNRGRMIDLLRQRAQAGAVVIVATHDQELMRECDQLLDLSVASLAGAR